MKKLAVAAFAISVSACASNTTTAPVVTSSRPAAATAQTSDKGSAPTATAVSTGALGHRCDGNLKIENWDAETPEERKRKIECADQLAASGGPEGMPREFVELGENVAYFARGSAVVSDALRSKLLEIRSALAAMSIGGTAGRRSCYRIRGHTDSTGPEKLNEILSKARAQAVVSVLQGTGSNRLPVDFVAVGVAAKVPKNARNPAADENRRVTFMNSCG